MRRNSEASLCLAIAALCTPIAASPMPQGYFHGEMVSYEDAGEDDEGQIIAKDAEGQEFTCSYDHKSYFEYRDKKIGAKNLLEGDPLLILVDHTTQRFECYVRIIHVEVPEPKFELRGVRQAGFRPRNPTPGNIGVTFAQVQERRRETVGGVVAAVTSDGLILHTRDGDRELFLNNATRYLNTGRPTGFDQLSVNQRVSVEVGRDAGGRAVALQVSWGSILRVP